MIPNGRGTEEQPAIPDGPASQEVVGRYRADGLRRWLIVAFAVAWLLVGTVQFVRLHQWWGLAFAAVWAALAATVWVRPQMVISDQGVRLGWRIIPWSQVVEVVAPPSNGWKQDPPQLVLRDGRRQPLPELTASQIDGLRSLARKHGSPIPP